MTTPLNRDRFSKVLALAESPSDGEALAAIRKAASMARAAGMTLGEALGGASTGTNADGEALGWVNGFEAGVRAGKLLGKKDGYAEGMAVARAEAKITIDELKKRHSKNQHYERGVIDGRNAERADADARVCEAQEETNEATFRRGYAKGQDDAQSSVNSAYSRGFADGKAGVDFSKAGTARGRRAR